MSKVCHACGNFGIEGGCPRCGKTPKTVAGAKILTLNAPVEFIPVHYQGKLWEPPANDVTQASLTFYGSLSRVHDEFLKGNVPAFSMYVSSNAKGGKHEFAYSCMQTAMAQGFSATPLLSASDWRRLYRVSITNPYYKLYDQFTWDDLIRRDVAFMFIDHSDERFDVISLLKDVMDSRAAFGKPTFIISDYKLNTLNKRWGTSTYGMIYNPDPSRDTLRFPVVLHYFKEDDTREG